MTPRGRQVLLWGLIVSILVLDVVTKAVAEVALAPRGVPREVIGEWVRLTLVYNTGAAFGMVALVILGRLYRQTPEHDRFRITSIGLVCAGAIGNVIDRIRHPMGVVDFIDIGVGMHRWPTFNVADMAVSVGAFMLAWSLWAEDRARARAMSAKVSSSVERA
jgi:signal peptidase II